MKSLLVQAPRARLAHAAVTLLALLVSGAMAGPVFAQQAAAPPLEMRHFWHVFIAYALAWVLIGGWLFSIVRRLRKVEERLR
jgi:CcmD family protein